MKSKSAPIIENIALMLSPENRKKIVSDDPMPADGYLLASEQIDPIIKATIEDLKKNNPKLADEYENSVLERLFRKNSQDAEEVIRQIKTIESWYSDLQENKIWLKIQSFLPKLANDLLKSKDDIDIKFFEWKEGAQFSEVENAIHKYAESWSKLFKEAHNLL